MANPYPRPHRRTTCEECLRLASRALRDAGLLRPSLHLAGPWGWASGASVALTVRTSEAEGSLRIADATAGQPRVQDVALTTRPGRFGGLVWWLCCPCGRRVRDLYRPPTADRWACVVCHRLTWKSRQRNHRRQDCPPALVAGQEEVGVEQASSIAHHD